MSENMKNTDIWLDTILQKISTQLEAVDFEIRRCVLFVDDSTINKGLNDE